MNPVLHFRNLKCKNTDNVCIMVICASSLIVPGIHCATIAESCFAFGACPELQLGTVRCEPDCGVLDLEGVRGRALIGVI
jgi:hypothetical protein